LRIELSDTQKQKWSEWTSKFPSPLPYIGATGGHFGLKIIFTSIGLVIIGFAWNGEEIDLTEY